MTDKWTQPDGNDSVWNKEYTNGDLAFIDFRSPHTKPSYYEWEYSDSAHSVVHSGKREYLQDAMEICDSINSNYKDLY